MKFGVRYLTSQDLVKKGDLNPGYGAWNVLEVKEATTPSPKCGLG